MSKVCWPWLLALGLLLALSGGQAAAGHSNSTLADPPLQLAGLGEWVQDWRGSDSPELLPVAKAFKLAHRVMPNGDLSLAWEVAEDCYLYRDKLKFSLLEGAGYRLGEPQLPPATMQDDEAMGRVPVYLQDFQVRIPVERLSAEAAASAQIEVGYQGCAGAVGVCYPPQTRVIEYAPPAAADNKKSSQINTTDLQQETTDAAPAKTPSKTATQDAAATSPMNRAGSEAALPDWQQRLTSAGMLEMIWLSLGLGLLIAFTACMYPLLPILSSLIIGQGRRVPPLTAFGLSLTYVQGMALTFGAIGAVMAWLGSAVGIQAYFQSPWLLIPFAGLFVLLALSLFGFFDLQVPAAIQSRLTAASNRQHGGTLLGVALMGVLSALIVGPCGGPVLVAELAYAATSGEPLKGFIALFAFGNGLGIPLLVIGVTGGSLLPKAGPWMTAVKAAAGVVLLGVAIVFLERLPGLFPPPVTMAFWAALLLGAGVFLGAFEAAPLARSWARFWKAAGIGLVLYGTLVLIGGLTGSTQPTDPLRNWRYQVSATSTAPSRTSLDFTRVESLAELRSAVAAAGQAGQVAMLDVYADWCSYCKTLERQVFPDPAVQRTLSQMRLLKTDVTAMDQRDTALLRALDISLPPTLVFYAPDGSELRAARIVGELSAREFAAHARQVLQTAGAAGSSTDTTNTTPRAN